MYNFKKLILLVLAVVMAFSMSASVFVTEEENMLIDNAPIIGDFKYDPDMAALVRQKENIADLYYNAKMAGDLSKANMYLQQFGQICGEKTYNTINENTSCACSNKQNNNQSMYNFSNEVVSAETVLNIKHIKKLSSSNLRIKDCKISLAGIYDKNIFIIVLYTEQNKIPTIKEIGLYNLDSEIYDTILPIEKNQCFEICDYNKDYMVLQMTENDWKDSSLFVINFTDKNLVNIYNYSPEYNSTSVAYNNVLLKENKIYFDDVTLINDILDINLFCFDLLKKEVKMIEEHMQNPMEFKNGVLAITRDESGRYKKLKTLNDEYLFSMQKMHVSELGSSCNELYSLINKHTDKKEKYTLWAIKDMIRNKELLETKISIDQLTVSDYFVCWRNFTEHLPYIYDIKQEEFLIFDNIGEGYNSYILKDNGGILLNIVDDDKFNYYYFER